MRALACVRACVRTCACDLSSKRGASDTNLKTSIGRARPEEKPKSTRTRYGHATGNLATAVVDSTLTSLTRKLCIL